jgi:hypothetical protein
MRPPQIAYQAMFGIAPGRLQMANTLFLAAVAVLLYRVLRELWRLYARNVGSILAVPRSGESAK